MASASTPVERIFKDLQECISSLLRDFQENSFPITDDNTLLHRFCAKFEFLLQYGQKEKTNLLGSKKDYWDFFCACLRSHRVACEGLRFVKSKSEIKTSIGRGRGFIRFCLVHKCLADSLQHCFSNSKITNEWYHETAIWCSSDKWNILVSSLYELSDVNFALSPEGLDLDVSWPTFARKVFDMQYSWQPPSRSISISSLVSQNDSLAGQSILNERDEENDNESLKFELSQSQDEVCKLMAKLLAFQQREFEMAQKIDQLEKLLQQKDCITAAEEEIKMPANDLESLKTELELKICQSEETIGYLKSMLNQKETFIDSLNLTIENVQGQNANLIEQAENASKERDVTALKLAAMSETVQDLKGRLDATENDLVKVMSRNDELLLKLDNAQSTSENIKQLVSAMEDKNHLLDKQVISSKEIAQKCEADLKEANNKNDELNSQLSEVSASLQDFSHEIDVKGIELETAQQKIICLEDKVNYFATVSPESKITELVDKVAELESANAGLQKEKAVLLSKYEFMVEEKKSSQRSEEFANIRDDLEAQLTEKCRQLTESNGKLALLQNNTEKLIPFLEKQELMIDNLKAEMSKMLAAAQKLSRDLKELMPMVHNATRKEVKGMESSVDSAFNGGSLGNSFDSAWEPLPPFSTASETSNVVLGELDIHFFPLVRTIHRMIAKLRGLMKKQNGMEHVMSACQNMSCQLFNVLNDYERKVVTASSLEVAHNAILGLTKEHQKLQAAEAILRYELREKRKLLTRLRQQLEVTREEWNRVKSRNIESRNEWCSLREEFAKRYKQASEESGFVDGAAEHSEASSVVVEASEPITLEDEQGKLPDSPDEHSASLPICEGAEGISETSTEVDCEPPPRTRLEIMEDECQLLYSSLVHSSQRSDFLMQRLNLLLTPSDNSSNSSKDGSPFPTEIVENVDRVLSPDCVPLSPVPSVCNGQDNNINFPSVEESLNTQCLGDEILLSSSPHPTDLLGAQEHCENIAFVEHSLETENVNIASNANLRKRALEALVRRCKSERSDMEIRETELKETLHQIETENSELKNKVAALMQEKHLASKKDSEFRKRAEFIFRHERDASDVRVHSLSEEKILLEKELKEVQELLCKRMEYLSSLEKDFEHARESLKECKESCEQEVTSLRFQISTEALKYERALKNYVEQESGISVMGEKMNNQEHLIQSLEIALAEIQSDRKIEQTKQWQELEELQFMLAARDEECITLNEEAKKAVKDFDDTKNALSQLHVQAKEQETKLKRTIKKLEMQLSQWKDDNEDLKKQIIKLTKDKDSLWKKTEKLSHLQHLQIADRWMDDSEAINCLLCKAAFSFTLRKHHCRLCGRIFCHDCTNNWLLIASSSHKVRACMECYMQQMDLYSKEDASDIEDEGAPTSALAISTITNASVNDGQSSSLPVSHLQKAGRTNIVSSLPIIRMFTSSPSNASTPETNDDLENETSTSKDGKSNEPPKIEFDVITDEEIVRSLSACSPYTPHQSLSSSPNSRMQMSLTRSADEIEKAGAAGSMGEIWVNAGSSYGMPILIDQPGQVLSWEFTSEPQSIVFSVLYHEAAQREVEVSWDTLLARTRVQSHLFPIQGHLAAKRSGVYLLVFNNYFSRFMAKKVSYVLKVNNKNINSTSCSSIEEALYEE